MATRSTHRETSTQTADIANAQSTVAELTRQQLATAASTASALLRALESFHLTQQHMLQRAALLQSQTAERLRSANSPTEMMAVQSSVMLSGISEMAQYAQEMMLASLKAQNEFMRPAEEQQAAGNQAAQAAQSMSAAASPLFQAWQSVFAAPMAAATGGATGKHH